MQRDAIARVKLGGMRGRLMWVGVIKGVDFTACLLVGMWWGVGGMTGWL